MCYKYKAKMTKMLYKKGMSPIIATILLIALAVSIGATVISLGGIYWEKIKLGDGGCSNFQISAFELEKGKECQGYKYETILNFYTLNETKTDPQCYSGIATGEAKICVKREGILDYTWIPIKDHIG